MLCQVSVSTHRMTSPTCCDYKGINQCSLSPPTAEPPDDVRSGAVPPKVSISPAVLVQVPDNSSFGASPGEIFGAISFLSGPRGMGLHSLLSVAGSNIVMCFRPSPFCHHLCCPWWQMKSDVEWKWKDGDRSES